jgi:hypothetical protein
VIDVSAHGVDWRQRAEPRKYIRAANIPGMDDGIAAGKCRERLRRSRCDSHHKNAFFTAHCVAGVRRLEFKYPCASHVFGMS